MHMEVSLFGRVCVCGGGVLVWLGGRKASSGKMTWQLQSGLSHHKLDYNEETIFGLEDLNANKTIFEYDWSHYSMVQSRNYYRNFQF